MGQCATFVRRLRGSCVVPSPLSSISGLFIDVGLTLDVYGVPLRCLGRSLGHTLGSLGVTLVLLRLTLGVHGVTLGPLGCVLGPLWSSLGSLWGHFGSLGCIWGHFGSLGGSLGSLWVSMGSLLCTGCGDRVWYLHHSRLIRDFSLKMTLWISSYYYY